MSQLFLFDMDGTLTPPRQKMPIGNEMMLGKIQHAGHDVGIITGSDMDYIRQQCATLFDMSLIATEEIHFLPCNGTKYLLNGEEIYSKDMKEYMGVENWRSLVKFLLKKQYDLAHAPPVPIEGKYIMPLTGHFFNYRQSMLNWCPIGRNAEKYDRLIWESLDEDNRLRKPIIESINQFLSSKDCDITIKFGGDTSFDIFPTGWDKTYPLEFTDLFDKYELIYFIGDRCGEAGNDFEIYNHSRTLGFETSSPEETILIVNKILSGNV